MDDITFGEVEEQRPAPNVRPDRNRHFAVVACGEVAADDLPIFVDLDVLGDMEAHALTDTTVELGGVMLGGQYEDEEGRPFVVVTDSLRAEHYEATKGSFKFTHETWQQISRQREEFPDDLAMVGWYHTHPDWGVFLSGMDTFICDNFFNKTLDVALVIDPCRQDRGWFMWTKSAQQRLKRTGGFYITASRYRAAELEECAAMLSGEMPMRTATTSAGPGAAPVIHLHEEKPGWMGTAVLGMLFSQLCVLVLVAVMILKPATPPTAEQRDALTTAKEKIEDLEKDLARHKIIDDKARIIERIVPTLRTDQGKSVIDELAEREREVTMLHGTAEGYRKVADEKARLEDRMKKTLEDNEALKANVAAKTQEIAALNRNIKDLTPKKKEGEEAANIWSNPYVLWGSIAGAIILLMAALMMTYVRPTPAQRIREEEKPAPPEVEDRREER